MRQNSLFRLLQKWGTILVLTVQVGTCLDIAGVELERKELELKFEPVVPHINFTTGVLETRYSTKVDKTRWYSYQFPVSTADENFVVHTIVANDSLSDYPVIFEVKQQRHSQSWQLPMQSSTGKMYYDTNRTVCINEHLNTPRNGTPTDNVVTVTVSTLSSKEITFVLVVRSLCPNMKLNVKNTVTISLITSQLIDFMDYDQSAGSDAVTVFLRSNDSDCLIVSVQQPQCPYLDSEEKIRYRGYWQTMTTRGSFTLRKNQYPYGFFLVLVAASNNTLCTTDPTENAEDDLRRFKTVEVVVRESVSDWEYFTGWLIPLIYYAILIGETFVITFVARACDKLKNFLRTCYYAFRHRNPVLSQNGVRAQLLQNNNGPSAGRCRWFLDKLIPPEYVRLNQICTMSNECLKQATRRYFLVTLAVGIYYTLPAMQLVYLYLFILNTTGNLDMCYYNFECAHPAGPFKDFNHLYSNIGYLFASAASAIWLWLYDNKHQSQRQDRHGIPPHLGLSFAIAMAIFFEGVLSGSYHVCPNHSNFHHDTCFMFVCVFLTGLKLYQSRHPDMTMSASTAFVVLGLVMIADLGGEVLDNWWYMGFFIVCHIFSFFLVATQMFFLGRRPIFSLNILKDIGAMLLNNRSGHSANSPIASRDVYHLIIVSALLNLSLIGRQCLNFHYTSPYGSFDFGTNLLIILGANVVLYLLYYMAMKLVHREQFSHFCLFHMFLTAVFWGLAVSNFSDAKTSWEETPAGSRALNRPCKFYDSHDKWHMLSAVALYTTVVALETMDSKLLNTEHRNIAVF